LLIFPKQIFIDILQEMDIDEDVLLGEENPKKRDIEISTSDATDRPDASKLARSQRRNRKQREKLKRLKQAPKPVSNAESSQEGSTVSVNSNSADAERPSQALRFRRRPNQARHVPNDLFQQAFQNLLEASTKLRATIELLKYYNYRS
jgi:hypothetical protein